MLHQQISGKLWHLTEEVLLEVYGYLTVLRRMGISPGLSAIFVYMVQAVSHFTAPAQLIGPQCNSKEVKNIITKLWQSQLNNYHRFLILVPAQPERLLKLYSNGS